MMFWLLSHFLALNALPGNTLTSMKNKSQLKELSNDYLFDACASQNIQNITHAIYFDADVNFKSKSNHYETPLICAAVSGNLEVVELLLRAGADINAADNTGQTPLMIAVLTGNSNLLEFLLERTGVNVNAADNLGQSALMKSVYLGNASFVRKLCEAGADVNDTRWLGSTPLIIAARHSKNRDVILNLLSAGADKYAVDELGLNAFQQTGTDLKFRQLIANYPHGAR